MKEMSEKGLVTGLPKIEEEISICDSCLVGKQTRRAFPASASFRASLILELVHGDLCGPITPSTLAGNRYIFVLIDDFSRYMWAIMLKEKSQAFEKFKRFKATVEMESGAKIKTLRTDRGGEFTSKEFSDFCENMGINRHLTAPYTPQQNGVVERRNRTLMEMTRSVMKARRIPNQLWGEAVRHCTYLLNRISTKALENSTPYEKFKKRTPNIQHLRVFGCTGYAKVTTPNLKKLDDRSKPLVHLGIEPGSKAYRLFDPTTKRIVVSRDVVFHEEATWRWEDKDKMGDEPGQFHLTVGNQSQSTAPHPEEDDEETEDALSDTGEAEEDADETGESLHPTTFAASPLQPEVRRSTRPTSKPRYLHDYVMINEMVEIQKLLLVLGGEPTFYDEAMEVQEWREAMNAEIDSINKNNTWKLVKRPPDVKPIGLKWVYKLKKNTDGPLTNTRHA